MFVVMLCVLAPIIAVVNVCTEAFSISFLGDKLQTVEILHQYVPVLLSRGKKHNENA